MRSIIIQHDEDYLVCHRVVWKILPGILEERIPFICGVDE
jgi:hypothetical protein